MNATQTNERTRDLERLDRVIHRTRRAATAHRNNDKEMAATYDADVKDLLAVRDAVARGDLAEAGRLAYDLDTRVRDDIPTRLFHAIMKANGTNS